MLILDTLARSAHKTGKDIPLTFLEWKILARLSGGETLKLENPNHKAHIVHLRRKGVRIKTIRGFGYKLDEACHVNGPSADRERTPRECIGHHLCNGSVIYCKA